MKTKSLLIYAIVVAVIITGCAPEYEISIKISPVEGGQVDGEGIYGENETVELKATPEEGFYFSGWEENGKIINSDETYVFDAKEKRILKAVFKEKQEREDKEEEEKNGEQTVSKDKKESISSAVDAGLEFLIDNPEKGNPWETYTLLDYLYRKFELDKRYAFENTFDKEKYKDHVISPIERLADPDYVAPLEYIEEETKEPYIQWLMARAMYSDHHPVNKEFIENLSTKLEEYRTEYENTQRRIAGYKVTHIILCFRWLHELGYDLKKFGFEEPWEEFADYLVNIVESEKAKTDLAFEALAFLQYIDQGHRVEESWIETVLSHQMPEGGWSKAPDNELHGHPTVLAVWALLEYIYPHADAPILKK